MININELSEQSKELVWLIYSCGGSFIASKLNRDDTISLRSFQDKNVNIDVPKDEAVMLYEAGHLCIPNIDIINGKVIIKHSTYDPLDDKYKFSRDHFEFLNQHPKVREDTIRRNEELEEQERKLAEERARQQELERIQKEKEEAYLKTPKGKIEHQLKKAASAFGDMVSMFGGNRISGEDPVVKYAEKRLKTNGYFGDIANRRLQKAQDQYVVNHYKNKK